MAPVSETKPTPFKLQLSHHVQQVLDRTAQPIELVDVHGVHLAQTD